MVTFPYEIAHFNFCNSTPQAFHSLKTCLEGSGVQRGGERGDGPRHPRQGVCTEWN